MSAGTSQNHTAEWASSTSLCLASTLHLSGRTCGTRTSGPRWRCRGVVQPLRLLLGKFALDLGNKKLEAMKKDFDAWKQTTIGADYPEFQDVK